MRILANYGSRENGSSYNVTFETTGDVKMEQAEETIDELFRLAKEAVVRQMEENAMEFPSKESGVTIPRVANNRNGNGNGSATEKQKKYLKSLQADTKRGVDIDKLDKAAASQMIKELMEVS